MKKKYNMEYRDHFLGFKDCDWIKNNEVSPYGTPIRKIGISSVNYDPNFISNFKELYSKRGIIEFDQNGRFYISKNDSILEQLALNKSYTDINPLKFENFGF